MALFRRIAQRLRGTSKPTARVAPTRGPPPRQVRRPEPPPLPSPDEPRALLLYKYDSCPFCRRVAETIAKLGLEVPVADTREDPARRDELQEATGRAQVPCLFIDGQPLFESDDISAWLTRYAEAGHSA